MSAHEATAHLAKFDHSLARLVVATAERSDEEIHRSIGEVLKLVRDHLQMDVVFVSCFQDGQRVFRFVEQDERRPLLQVGQGDPLEQSFCQRVVDGRMPELVPDLARWPGAGELPATPFPIGAHLSTPIVLSDGRIYGTFCCFRRSPDESLAQRDLKRLRMASEMAARLIDRANANHG
jgi:GAF domain-containing protein